MNQDQNQYSIDYLNQIAPQAPKKGLSGKLPIILIALGVVSVIVIILMILAGLGSGNGPTAERLAARLQATATISTEAQSTIKSSQLRTLNSNLNIFLTNTNRDLIAPLAASGVESNKLNETVVAQETGTEVSATLEDARLNATFDRTYARELTYQLETLLVLIQQVYDDSSNQALRDVLSSAYENLAPIQESFETFNAATA